MRFSPTRLLQGLRFTAPVLLLTLAACGGGGGSSTPAPTYSLGGAVSNTSGNSVVLLNNGGDNTTVPSGAMSYAFATKLASGASYNITVLANPAGYICSVLNATGTMSSLGVANADVTCLPSFTLGGTVSNLLGSGLKLRNNGGDDLSVTGSPYVFATQVAGGQPYDITVLSQPTSPNQICDFTGSPTPPSGTMPSSSITDANVACVSSYSIGGTSTGGGGVIGLSGNLVLQNNAGDNLAVAGSGTTYFTFSTPLKTSTAYSVTVLKDPYGQDCHTTSANTSGTTGASDVTNVTFTCVTASIPSVDRYAYATNIVSNDVTGFAINASDGSLGGAFTAVSGLNNPSSIVVHTVGATSYAYVVNYNSGGTGYISAYTINSGDGSLTHNTPDIATGKGPYVIRKHPTGNYAYVVNKVDNTVSAYSIDASGTLARIDTDGVTAATQTSIATGSSPIAMAIHPGGGYAYVVNLGSNTVSVYSIDANGALTPKPTIATGSYPYSIAIDPTGRYAYVANSGAASVTAYTIDSSTGALTRIACSGTCASDGNFPADTTPKSVVVDPSGAYVYVANSGVASVTAYTINSGTGALVQIDCSGVVTCSGKNFKTGGNFPSSIRIDNSGQYLYAANYDTINNISAFSIGGTGALTPIATVSAGSNPNSIATAP